MTYQPHKSEDLPEPAAPLLRMPLHQAAQWGIAVECAESEPHKNVVLEGRTVLALERAIKAALCATPRPAGAEVVLPELPKPDLVAERTYMGMPQGSAPMFGSKKMQAHATAAVHLDREQRMGGALSDARILHLWGTHVGDPTENYPFTDKDKLAFARALLAAQSSEPANPAQESQHGSL